ncbi:MAG: MmgE/PrpD family protein [Steroidobacteraceae bacterium]
MTDAALSGLSLRLAEHVVGTSGTDLRAATVHAASRALLDAVGVMQAASSLATEAQPFIHFAQTQGGRPEASVLGTGVLVPAPLAALANGAMAHALDYEDAYDAAPVHPNASLIPAVLALAQCEPGISGRDLLTAIAVGCDLVCRLGHSLRRPLEDGGWYPPPILGAWGAVAGAARLLHLSPRQLLDAWSLMLLQTSTPGEIKHGNESAIRAVREAFPAQAAVTAVRLAQRGIRGFDAPLEGRDGFYRLFAGGAYDPAALTVGLGERWAIEQLSFKPWPSCRGTHAAIECALRLRTAPGVDLSRIGVVVEGGEVQGMLAEPALRKREPASAIEAKFSLPFTVATALLDGVVTLDSFSADALRRPDVRALARRIRFERRPEWGREQAVAGAVRIELVGRQSLREEVLIPRGAPQRPLDDATLLGKFVDCVGRAQRPLASEAAAALADRILGVDSHSALSAFEWTAPA